jgi:hypothetical protein
VSRSPLILEVRAPFVGHAVAVSNDPDDVRLVLERIVARRRREARDILDPASIPVALAEVERLCRLVEIITSRKVDRHSDRGRS